MTTILARQESDVSSPTSESNVIAFRQGGTDEQIRLKAKDGEKAQADLQSVVADNDKNEKANRRLAFKRHASRSNAQLVGSILAIAAVAFTPPFRTLVNDAFASPPLLPGGIVLVHLPAAVLLVAVLWLLWYWREQKIEWALARANSSDRTPSVCALGYLSTFRIYTEAKHTAFYARLFGCVAAYSAAYGVASQDFSWSSYPVAIGSAETLLALAMVVVGFEIGRDFVPGRILVANTIVMSFLATTSQTDYTKAQNDAHILLAGIRNERPWSFYSFKRVRGSSRR